MTASFGGRARIGAYASYFREKYGVLPRPQARIRSGTGGTADGSGNGQDAWRWGDSLSALDGASCGDSPGYFIPGLPGGDDPLSFCIARSPYRSGYQSTLNSW